METTKNFVVDDLFVVGGELCSIEHLVVRNEIVGIVILACVDGDLYITADMEFVIVDVQFVVAGVDSLVANVDEGLLLKHYIHFFLGCDYVDLVTDMYLILMF